MRAIEFRPLNPEDVEVRVGRCSEKMLTLLLYKDARCDARMLDEAIGPENWQCDYWSIDGKLFCKVGIRFKDGEWVWKSDTGTPSNMESQKGEASDAFKRACFKWGIGRELYSAPEVKVFNDACTIKQGRNGNWQCYDDFRVTELEVDDGRIVKLTIKNMSRKGLIVYGNGKGRVEAPANDDLRAAKQAMWGALQGYAERHGRTAEEILEGVKKRPEWEAQHESADWLLSVAREFEEADG